MVDRSGSQGISYRPRPTGIGFAVELKSQGWLLIVTSITVLGMEEEEFACHIRTRRSI